MRKIYLFMMISLDGFFEGPDQDLSWHHVDNEFNRFAAKQLEESGAILFGRRSYQLMENFWPDYKPEDELNTVVRNQMDNLPKFVYSTTLKEVKETDNWKNVNLRNEIDPAEIKKLKEQSGKDIAVLGSSDLCVSLLELDLLDELRIMVNPVIIGQGKQLFEGLDKKLEIKFKSTKIFGNGNILLTYSLH